MSQQRQNQNMVNAVIHNSLCAQFHSQLQGANCTSHQTSEYQAALSLDPRQRSSLQKVEAKTYNGTSTAVPQLKPPVQA
ncbi:hypothetical protein DSO57_1012661 [Entomophthora muscae]|uniref:Uncharacterized protein n=1 Tax=Entomophthora muscae TaxID=34485 RepID=A0ACC2RX20_9FUNG|nr:hypothetical protein DSO57_1012661 [Entomophthora muscae]